MEEINRFVVLAQSGRFSVTDLCEQFGISRKTGYKHLERYAALGLAGLRPRSIAHTFAAAHGGREPEKGSGVPGRDKRRIFGRNIVVDF